jgi:hypothetical protein
MTVATTSWVFFYMSMNLNTYTLNFGISQSNMGPSITEATQINSSFYTPVGTILTFSLANGLMIAGNSTSNPITMTDVKVWLNVDLAKFNYGHFMQSPVSAWYRIAFFLANPTSFSLSGNLPSQPTLNTITSKYS